MFSSVGRREGAQPKINRLLFPSHSPPVTAPCSHSLPLQSTLHTKSHQTMSCITIPPSTSVGSIRSPQASRALLKPCPIYLQTSCLTAAQHQPTACPSAPHPPNTTYAFPLAPPLGKLLAHTLPAPLHYPNPAHPSGPNTSLPPLLSLLLLNPW